MTEVDPATLADLCDALGREASPREVASWLERAITEARAAWPGIDVSATAFVRHLERHASRDVSLDTLHVSDVYLAVACSQGSSQAIAAFETAYAAEMAAVARRVSSTVDVDDVVQGLRELLFVGRDGPPKLEDFSGRGELRSWLRVVVSRATLNAATRSPRDRPADDDQGLIDVAGAAESAEVLYFRLHYEAEVKLAIPAALALLSVHERLLLRQHYIDQLTLEELGRVHGIHVATVKRRLASARAALTTALRATLAARLNLSPSELRSVLTMVQSRLHVTMRRLLPDGSRSE